MEKQYKKIDEYYTVQRLESTVKGVVTKERKRTTRPGGETEYERETLQKYIMEELKDYKNEHSFPLMSKGEEIADITTKLRHCVETKNTKVQVVASRIKEMILREIPILFGVDINAKGEYF